MSTWPPACHIVDTAVPGVVRISVEDDCEDGRGGLLQISERAIALLPEAIAKAIAARAEGAR